MTLLGANLLKLRPCIEVQNGKMGVAKKYRGSFQKCVTEYITDRLAGNDNLALDRIFITHSGGIDQQILDEAQRLVRALQPFKEICVTRAGCTVSCHCGPGTLGILYIRKS